MSLILFKNAKLLDPTRADLQDGVSVLVEGTRIREVSPRSIRTAGATVVDVGGRTYGQFAGLNNWPFGAALAFVLMTATLILTVGSNVLVQRRYRR